jgi:hypothetical protein
MANKTKEKSKQFKLTPRAKAFREDLRVLLIEHCGGCGIQEGGDGKMWPCGTCLCSVLGGVLDVNAPEYQQRNEPVDRINEIWRAVLQMRDAK